MDEKELSIISSSTALTDSSLLKSANESIHNKTISTHDTSTTLDTTII